MVTLEGKTMGTTYTIKYFGKKNIHEKIKAKLTDVNRQMSTYIPTSEITLFNKFKKTDRWFAISKEFYDGLNEALEISKLTGGYFDPTVGPLVNAWGFGPKKSKELPSRDKIQKIKMLVGFDKLLIHPTEYKIKKALKGLQLDLSASAKGYAVDLVGELLEQNQIKNYLVEIGGEIKTSGMKGNKPWTLAVQTPKASLHTQAKAVFQFTNMTMATSGDYRNFKRKNGKKFSHTIDIVTGKPVVNKLASVTVLHPNSCLYSDAMATALMAMGETKSRQFVQKHRIAAYFIIRSEQHDSEFEEYKSPGFVELTK